LESNKIGNAFWPVK